MIILFVAASVAFWVAVGFDAVSSRGGQEKTKLFRDKAGIFSLNRYLIWMSGFYAAVAVLAISLDDQVSWISGAGILIGGAVIRFRVAAKNRKINPAR